MPMKNHETTPAETESASLTNQIEISPVVGDVAVCIIKPDAFNNREAIVRQLKNSGLYVVERKTKQLTDQFVEEALYDPKGLPKPIAEATQRHFASGPSEVLLVRGGNAVITKLVETVGLKTDPSLCSSETIRYLYGTHVPEELEGGLKYWRNAAHRPKDQTEAQRDLKNFREL